MKAIEFLAVWIIGQLLIIGFSSGIGYNNYADCKPKEKPESSWIIPFVGAALPLVFFTTDGFWENEFCVASEAEK